MDHGCGSKRCRRTRSATAAGANDRAHHGGSHTFVSQSAGPGGVAIWQIPRHSAADRSLAYLDWVTAANGRDARVAISELSCKGPAYPSAVFALDDEIIRRALSFGLGN